MSVAALLTKITSWIRIQATWPESNSWVGGGCTPFAAKKGARSDFHARRFIGDEKRFNSPANWRTIPSSWVSLLSMHLLLWHSYSNKQFFEFFSFPKFTRAGDLMCQWQLRQIHYWGMLVKIVTNMSSNNLVVRHMQYNIMRLWILRCSSSWKTYLSRLFAFFAVRVVGKCFFEVGGTVKTFSYEVYVRTWPLNVWSFQNT